MGVGVPSDSHGYTGLYYNGTFVTSQPTAPNVYHSLDSTPVNLDLGRATRRASTSSRPR